MGRLLISAIIAVIAAGDVRAQTVPDCHRREAAAIAERERAAAEWPKALLPQIELAVCYDQAWRFQDVEPAIAKAAAILDAEIAAAPPVAPSPGARPLAGDGIPIPIRTRDAQADYPMKALVAGITGFVIVELVIDPKGNVREARPAKSVPEFDEAAVKAARKWKYEPTLIGGTASEVLTYAMIRFGQTTEPIPADWLAMAVFYYERGLFRPARGALDAAVSKSRDDRKRFGTFVPGPRGRGTGAGTSAPVKTKDVRPRYPASAISSRTSGLVVIEALLDEQGNIGRARIVSKPSILDAASLEAVLQWQFTPAMRDGSPIAIAMTTTVTFSMR